MVRCRSQEAGQVVWYSHLFKNIPQFIVIHTIKGFGVVNKAKVDLFWSSLAFLMIQQLRRSIDRWYYHHQIHLLSIHLSTYSGCCAVTALHSHFIHGSNLGLLHCRQIPYQLNHQGSPEQCEELNILLKVIKLARAGPDSDSKALAYSTLSSLFPGWDFFLLNAVLSVLV